MKISEVNNIVEKSTAKIIEAAEVRADLLAVAAHIPKGQRKKYGAELERILAKYDGWREA
jgi:hypothetical protein